MLQESNTWQNAILESTDFIVMTIDLEGNILSCNNGALQKLGYTEEEIIGKSSMVFHDHQEVMQRVQSISEELKCSIELVDVLTAKARKGLLPDENDWMYVCKDGSHFVGNLSVTPLKDEAGSLIGFLGIGKDVTKHKETERALHQCEAKFHTFMDNSPAASFIKDAEGRYIYVNQQFVTLLHQPREEIIGKTIDDLAPSEIANLMREHDDAVLESNESVSFEETITSPDGNSSNWLSYRFPLTDKAGDKLLGGISIDITQRIYYEQQLEDYQVRLEGAIVQLESVASTDSLSGLKNKGAFMLRLDEEIARASRYNAPLSLLMLDVDKFKEFNDAFGHPAGDDVLKTIAGLMREHARPGDFIARIGGEEFAIILSNTPTQGAYIVGERLRRAVRNTDWPSRPITISVGVAETAPERNDRNALYEAADQSLYQAKRNGRDQVAKDS